MGEKSGSIGGRNDDPAEYEGPRDNRVYPVLTNVHLLQNCEHTGNVDSISFISIGILRIIDKVVLV